MDYQLGMYEKALPADLSFHEKLQSTRNSGFDWLELSIDESDEKQERLYWNRQQLHDLQTAMDDTGVPILTMCLSGHRKYPLGSLNSAIRKKSLDIMERSVALAAELGIRVIQLAGYDVYYEESNSQTISYFCKNLELAVLSAARMGVCLGFETMETPFLDTISKGMKYIDMIHSPYLGMYPDIGNLKNSACMYGSDVVSDLKKGYGRIFAAHLKETKPGVYRNMRFGTGHTEYVPCISELFMQGVRMFTGEFWYLGEEDWQDNVRNSGVFLRDKIEQAYGIYAKSVQ
ncbi:MAG: L-ribulose-5-phosphate 3-epimerase [Sphaerochaeta sp.]